MTEAASTTPDYIDQACEILRASSDGDELESADLSLLQDVVNSSGKALSSLGQRYWARLYKQVRDGSYVESRKNNFFGVAGLSRDVHGNVSWKGQGVEHYSHQTTAKMIADARELGAVCMTLEAAGQSVNSVSVGKFFMNMDYGHGVPTDRYSLVWRMDPAGPLMSMRPITTTDRIEGLSDPIAHAYEANKRWGTPDYYPFGGARTQVVSTKEDYDALVTCLQSDVRLARDRQWREYSSHAVLGRVMDQVTAVISRDKLLSRNDLRDRIIGPALAAVTAQSEEFLQAQQSEMLDEPVRDCSHGAGG